jgi:alpha-beta hydrolase superfamily lysophospholipase
VARPLDLDFTAGAASLSGTLLLPDERAESARHPFVLLVGSWLPRTRDGEYDRAGHPGWFAPTGADRSRLLHRVAEALADRGVASLRWDKRGCGESRHEGAGVTWAGTDLFTLIDDARDALAALRGRPELDLRRTGIVAHGEGAVIALSVAIGDPAVGPLSLIAPSARSFRDVLRRAVATRSVDRDERRHPFVDALDRVAEELIESVDRGDDQIDVPLADAGGGGARSVSLRLAAFRQAFNTPPVALATMFRRSVTLVHGERDAWSHPDESILLAEALRAAGGQVRTLTVPRAGHDLAEASDEVLGEVADDLARRLEPRELPPVLLAIEELSDPRPRSR